MKKFNTNKTVALLGALCLVTSCFVGTTLARYTTTGEGSDTARVAKWGIVFDENGVDTFSAEYATGVDSNDDADVVAPGTDGGSTYEITGAPETAYQVTMKLDETVRQDVYLSKGNYTYDADEGYVGMDVAEGDFVDNGTYLTDAEYLPIEYTITLETENGDVTNNPTGTYRTLEDVNTALEAATVDFAANDPCDVVLNIDWAWAFQGQSDKMDTVLGDIIAENADLTASVDTSSTDIEFKVIMTASQVQTSTPVEP